MSPIGLTLIVSGRPLWAVRSTMLFGGAFSHTPDCLKRPQDLGRRTQA